VRTRGEGGSSDADVHTFWCKNLIYGVSARTREKGVEQCEQGAKGVNFSRFCADVFYGRPLIVLLIINYE